MILLKLLGHALLCCWAPWNRLKEDPGVLNPLPLSLFSLFSYLQMKNFFRREKIPCSALKLRARVVCTTVPACKTLPSPAVL